MKDSSNVTSPRGSRLKYIQPCGDLRSERGSVLQKSVGDNVKQEGALLPQIHVVLRVALNLSLHPNV